MNSVHENGEDIFQSFSGGILLRLVITPIFRIWVVVTIFFI